MNKFYVAITTTQWFSFLKNEYQNGRSYKFVNFWTPSTATFKALNEGDMFLFKLHSNKLKGENGEIVGGAIFSHHEVLSINDAWKKFGKGNGTNTVDEISLMLEKIVERNGYKTTPKIGCIILKNVFFLKSFIQEPSNWNKAIVRGKTYSTDEAIGADLYNQVMEQINSKNDRNSKCKTRIFISQTNLIKLPDRTRHECALCKMDNIELLEICSIKPETDCSEIEKSDINNYLVFCPNHAMLFKKGFISFNDTGNILISNKINGSNCILLNINPLMKISISKENKDYFNFHREHIFKTT